MRLEECAPARTPHADNPMDALVKPSSEIPVSMIRSPANDRDRQAERERERERERQRDRQ
eukprot:COSAG03_NODE_10529_length_645_cov_0.935897_1_plen_59_part_10